MKNRGWRRVESERGSVFLEYALLSAFVTLVAISAFTPGGIVNEGVGADYSFREIVMKLPIF